MIPAWLKSLSGGLLTALENERMPDQATPRRVADQFGQWSAHLVRHAGVRWAPYLLRAEICSFCDADALAACISCGDPCCLGHAYVSHRGELLCDECVEMSITKRRKRSQIELAFSYFNLTSSATFEEVTAVYRLRSKNEHPDAGGRGDMTVLNQKYHQLKEHFSRKAA